MHRLPEEIELSGASLRRIDAPAQVACWTAELPGDEQGTISIVVEPAGPPSPEAVESASRAIAGFEELVSAARNHLVAGLVDPVWMLDAGDRARLEAEPTPFGMPEAIVWSDGSVMIRFAECDLEVGREYGIGVNFSGSGPVGIEDLSGAVEVE